VGVVAVALVTAPVALEVKAEAVVEVHIPLAVTTAMQILEAVVVLQLLQMVETVEAVL
jgi:hypothetical protein